jgi:hypothetical protein
MRVLMVADVSSTGDITEGILAQALVGKLAGADASSSSTIRNLQVTVVGIGSSSTSGSGNSDGPASIDDGSSANFGTLSNVQGIISKVHRDKMPSTINSLPLIEGAELKLSQLLPAQSQPKTRLDSTTEVQHSFRVLADTVRVNVTFDVIGSLSSLGYQNANGFQVSILYRLSFCLCLKSCS